jgi:hypothetical protein
MYIFIWAFAICSSTSHSDWHQGSIKYNGDSIDAYSKYIKLIDDEDTHIPALTVEVRVPACKLRLALRFGLH